MPRMICNGENVRVYIDINYDNLMNPGRPDSFSILTIVGQKTYTSTIITSLQIIYFYFHNTTKFIRFIPISKFKQILQFQLEPVGQEKLKMQLKQLIK